MREGELSLNPKVDSITIDVYAANVLVRPDDVDRTTIVTIGEITDSVQVKEKDREAIIGDEMSHRIRNLTVGCNESLEFFYRRRQAKSRLYENQEILPKPCDGHIEIIVPRKPLNTFLVDSFWGNFTIKGLTLSKLTANINKGSIKVEDIDAVFTQLKTSSGDIDVELLDEIVKYRMHLCSVFGKQEQIPPFDMETLLLNQKRARVLSATSDYGNIKVLFKGKK